MSTIKENGAVLGVGAAACVACCAGPIVGVLAAIGIGAAAGYLVIGSIAVIIGILAITFLFTTRRRRRRTQCGPLEPVAVALASRPSDH